MGTVEQRVYRNEPELKRLGERKKVQNRFEVGG